MRLPSLDGLRAVSIGLVLAAHTIGTRGTPTLGRVHAFGDIGNLGVRVFFVISGFLMAWVLELEADRTGRISLAGFLRRRAFRIVPAFAAYLAAIALLAAAGAVALQPGDLFASATFTTNYHPGRSWFVGHLWSLGVEAQFYTAWAAIRVLGGRGITLRAAAAALVAAPLARVAIYALAPGWRASIGETFETTVDALATGGLLAVMHGRLTASPSYLRLLESPLVATLPVALCALSALRPHIAFSYPLGETLMNLVIAVIVHHVIVHQQSAAGRLLNHKALTAIGTISYSLYLWQQPFLDRQGTGLAATFPLNLVFATGCGLVSYRFVEQPFLAWSHRIRVRRREPSRVECATEPAYAAVN